jgi:hypothetical protein
MDDKKNLLNGRLIMLLLTMAFSHAGFAACDVKASFTFTVKHNTVVFVNTSQGSNKKYMWDFGDKSQSFAISPSKYYLNSLTTAYLVKLYAWDSTDQSCMDSALTTVTVSDDSCHANAHFDFGAGSGKVGKHIFFWRIRSRLLNPGYEWLFGDGNSSAEKAPEHVYASPGQYQLCLIIKDINCSDTFCKTLVLDPSAPLLIKASYAFPLPGFTEERRVPITVYPNPGDGLYFIKDYHGLISSLEILDCHGKLIPAMASEDGCIDLRAYTSGVYQLRITDRNGMLFSQRLVKF